MAARTLTHRLVHYGIETVDTGIAHSSLGIVHRACGLTEERQLAVVLHLVASFYGVVRKLELFETGYAFEVEGIGISAVEAGGLESSMIVDNHVVASGGSGGTIVEIGHYLVVAIHEIDLKSLDAHF